MALRQRTSKELPGPPLGEWEETKRVALPGGGTMYVPLAFALIVNPKEQSPKYLWRGEPGEGSITVELASWHRAMRLDRARYHMLMQERLATRDGILTGDFETLTISGHETFYGLFQLAGDVPTATPFGAHARILTRNAGLLFEAMDADPLRVDRLARAVLSTLTL